MSYRKSFVLSFRFPVQRFEPPSQSDGHSLQHSLILYYHYKKNYQIFNIHFIIKLFYFSLVKRSTL